MRYLVGKQRASCSQTLALLYTVCLTAALKPDIHTWIDQLRSGDVRTLARAISTVENRAPGWAELLKAVDGKSRGLPNKVRRSE